MKADEIQPIYFERAYFLAPGEGSGKAYRLLAETMERKGRAGIATFVMRGKEYLVAILAENGILRAETMRFSDEVRSPKEVGLPEAKAAPKAAVAASKRLSETIPRRNFRPRNYATNRRKLSSSSLKRSKRGARM